MRVWRAAAEEAGQVASLLAEFGAWMGSSPDERELHANVERIMDGSDGEYLLGARDDGPPAGVCQIRFRWSVWKSAEDCWLEDLYVAEDARRGGLGRALVDAALERARERGCRRIELDVNEDNANARALYAACGFTEQWKSPGPTLYIGRAL